jgi:hypothetical protein
MYPRAPQVIPFFSSPSRLCDTTHTKKYFSLHRVVFIYLRTGGFIVGMVEMQWFTKCIENSTNLVPV